MKRVSFASYKSDSESEAGSVSKEVSFASPLLDKHRQAVEIKSKFFADTNQVHDEMAEKTNEVEKDLRKEGSNIVLNDLSFGNSSDEEVEFKFSGDMSMEEESEEQVQCFEFLKTLNESIIKKDKVVTNKNTNIKISIDHFEKIQHIKSGGFGEVFLAKKKSTGDIVAIKKINFRKLAKKNLFKFVLSETEILNNLDNSYQVRCYFSFTDSKYIYFVMEYLSGGDLELYLRKGKFKEEVMS